MPLAIRRSFAGRGMMAVMALGIVVAAVLLASAPIYARAMSDLGLRFLIADELDGRHAVWVNLYEVPVASPDGVALQRAVEKQIEGRTGWYADSVARNVTPKSPSVLGRLELPVRLYWPRLRMFGVAAGGVGGNPVILVLQFLPVKFSIKA